MRTVSRRPAALLQLGFSLVEVTLAIGVVAFAFVALLGMLPVGMTIFRRGIDASVGAQIAQRVINDAQQTDFDILIDERNLGAVANAAEGTSYTFRWPRIMEPRLRYFDEQGNEVVPKSGSELSPQEQLKVIYHVNTRITPQAHIPEATPGAPARHLAQVTVEIASNPGNVEIPIRLNPPAADDAASPDRNLFDAATPGISVQTYSALIGRNR